MVSKTGLLVAIVLAAAFLSPSLASAEVVIAETTKYYTVSGETGKEAVKAMSLRGPRSGFLARAIAQTWYSPKMGGDLIMEKGVCRVRDPSVQLKIRYTFPRLSAQAGPTLQYRWKVFMHGVIKHESQHADIARDMAAEMDRTMARFAMRAAVHSCRTAQRELGLRMDAIWKKYDGRQNAFDRREHRRGGEVQKLVKALAR